MTLCEKNKIYRFVTLISVELDRQGLLYLTVKSVFSRERAFPTTTPRNCSVYPRNFPSMHGFRGFFSSSRHASESLKSGNTEYDMDDDGVSIELGYIVVPLGIEDRLTLFQRSYQYRNEYPFFFFLIWRILWFPWKDRIEVLEIGLLDNSRNRRRDTREKGWWYVRGLLNCALMCMVQRSLLAITKRSAVQ